MRRNNGKSPRLDLNLNLSPQAKSGAHGEEGLQQQRRLSTSSSSPSSCVSSEAENGGGPHSPEATSMVLAACPRCLMYVMLAEGDPKCPKCHSAVILDFLHDTTDTYVHPCGVVSPNLITSTGDSYLLGDAFVLTLELLLFLFNLLSCPPLP